MACYEHDRRVPAKTFLNLYTRGSVNFIKCSVFLFVIFVLASCVTTQPVKDVLANPEAHLVSNFNESKFSDPVRAALGIKMPGKVTRQVRIDTVMTVIDGDRQENFEKLGTYQVLDNGLVRSMVQTGNNGILSLTEFDITYQGIFALIYQTMSHNAVNTDPSTYAKVIAKLDKRLENPMESTEYIFEYALAPEVQISNFSNQKTVCKTGKWFAANTLHPALTGMALPVDCEYFGINGQTFLKAQLAFIKDLGLTFRRETVSSTRKRTWKIRDVKL